MINLGGFRTVALNVSINEDCFKSNKKKKNKSSVESGPGIVPKPFDIENMEVSNQFRYIEI